MLSLERLGSTQTYRARAPCRAGRDRPQRYKRALHRREASSLRRKTVVRRASCELQRAAGFCVIGTAAPLRWLRLGRWRNTRACHARALCRASCDRLPCYQRTLHRWEASLFPCKTVARRASFDLHHAAGIRVTDDAPAPLRWLSLVRWENTQTCRACALCCAGGDQPTQYEPALHRREASFIRCKTVVRHASCDLQGIAGICVVDTQVLAESWEVAKHASLPRARAVPRWL